MQFAVTACADKSNPGNRDPIDKGEQKPDYSSLRRPFAIGHRGMSKTYPENTLVAIRACVENGMGVEFDVRTSKDGELVIIHDDNVMRTTNGSSAKVRELTLEQIKELDAGSWFDSSFANEKVPTLEEVLSMITEKKKGDVPLAVNLKDVDQKGEEKLVRLLKQYNLLNQAFCFDQSDEASERLKNLESSVKIGKNVTKSKLDKELSEGMIDVFLIGFVPTETEVEILKIANKDIVVNIGGSRANDNVPSAWENFLTAGINGILVDYVKEFDMYINKLFEKEL